MLAVPAQGYAAATAPTRALPAVGILLCGLAFSCGDWQACAWQWCARGHGMAVAMVCMAKHGHRASDAGVL